MNYRRYLFPPTSLLAAAAVMGGTIALAQAPGAFRPQAGEPPPQDNRGFPPPGAPDLGAPPPFGAGGFGPGPFMPGRGGPPGMMGRERELVKQFDQDGDDRLNAEERKAAREFLKQEKANNPGRGGPWGGPGRRGGPPGFFGGRDTGTPPDPGQRLTPADVTQYPATPFYDALTLRTLFLEFETEDWEQELADFNNTDVEVPATLIADGRTYRDVGVHFRGNTSLMMVPEGRKRPLNLSLDFLDNDQDVQGYYTLNLLYAHEDPTFMRTVLAFDIAREMIPAPKANFVRVAINGESWGVYVNAQQFNKKFIDEWFDTKKGERWKVTGSPGGRGGFSYLGDDIEAYRNIYTIKSKDEPAAWEALIRLCKTLESTPPDELVQALEPMLDLDGTLKFLAWDVTLANNDGFWVRASDYNLYRDKEGRFHLVPHDANETFSAGGGPGGPGGFGGGPGGPRGFGDRPGGPDGFEGRLRGRGPRFGPGGGGVNLDPLVAAEDPGKPLISKLLAVPALRAKYLAYVRQMADQYLNWEWLGPRVQAYRGLIAEDVKADTRKLDSFEAFEVGTSDSTETAETPRGRQGSLRDFADQRRAYLLKVTSPTSKEPEN